MAAFDQSRRSKDQRIGFHQRVVELLRELAANPSAIPPYDRKALPSLAKNMTDTISLISNAAKPNSPQEEAGRLVHYYTVQRAKRCGLAYLTTRLERVSELRWELGNQLPEDIKERLSPEEIAFHGEHCSILAEYMESIGCLDITGDMEHPPLHTSDVHILLRGTTSEPIDFMLESGAKLSLDNKTQQTVKREPALDSLIKQGLLTHIVDGH